MAGRPLRATADGTARPVSPPATDRAPSRTDLPPKERTRSRSERSDSSAAAGARASVCRHATDSTPIASPASPRPTHQQTCQLSLQLCELRLGCTRLQVHDVVEGRQGGALRGATKDLSDAAAEPLAHDRLSDLAARSDPEPCRTDLVGLDEHGQVATVSPAAMAITRLILRATGQSLFGSQTLVRIRS